jgi:hypothetical protein
MKRRLVSAVTACVVALLGLVALGYGPASAVTSLFNVTFDNGSLGGFGTSVTAPDAIGIAPNPDGAGQGLEFTSTTSATEMYYRYGTWTGVVTLDAKVYLGDTTHTRFIYELSGQTSAGTTLYPNLVTFDKTGLVAIGGTKTSTAYTAGHWYDVKAVVRNASGTFDAWIDGVQVADQRSLAPAGSTWVQTASVRFIQAGVSGTTGTMYLDNVTGTHDSTRDLGQSIDGWQERTYAAAAPTFAKDPAVTSDGAPTLRIQAPTGVQGSLWKDFPVQAGADYVVRTKLQLQGAGSGTNAQLNVTPLAGGQPVGAATTYSTVKHTGNALFTADSIAVRTPPGTDALRVELYLSGTGTVWFAPATVEAGLTTAVLGHRSSADVAHPVKHPDNMFGGNQWDSVASQTEYQKEQAVAPLLALSDAELSTAAHTSALSRTNLSNHPVMEQNIRRLADCYATTGDEKYAHAAILILREFAETYPSVPYLELDSQGGFFGPMNTVPIDAVYSYDLLFHSNQWTLLGDQSGVDLRAEVEGWFRQAVIDLYNFYSQDYGNIPPYGFAHVMGTASVLNDPEMIRLFVPSMDRVFTGASFYASGLWKEATVSYQDQVTGLAKKAFAMLKENWSDPAGYTDTTYGLKLNHADLGALRYPAIAQADKVDAAMHLPNDQLVPLNDTWMGPDNLAPYTADSPILAKDLHNTELYDYGHFALTQGDTADATQIRLNAPQIAAGPPYNGGHQHSGDLGIMLWGSGIETLPTVGYTHSPSSVRGLQIDAVSNNVPWVWDANHANYTEQAGEPTRAAILGYDPGTTSGGKVEFVEATSPGPAGSGVAVKRRIVMLVQLAGNRSYAVDLSTLRGGQAHQNFLRASEQEDDTLTASVPLTAHSGTVADLGLTAGRPAYRAQMTDPRTADGSHDMNFTWTGVTSGTSLQAYINGQPGDQLIFSKLPTNRRTLQDANKANDYPNEHFQRLRAVDPSQTTLYGAVYESRRTSQQALVRGVKWLPAADGNAESTTAVVDGGTFTDLVYLSNDDLPRTVQGVTFSGHVAVARVDKATGAIVWAYAWANGSVHAPGYALNGHQDLTAGVTATTSAYDGGPGPVTGNPNTITADTDLPQNHAYDGAWARITRGDGSGWAMRVDHIEGRTVHVHDWVPLSVSGDGARDTFVGGGTYSDSWQGRLVGGPVTISLSRSNFAATDATLLRQVIEQGVAEGKIILGAAPSLPHQTTELEASIAAGASASTIRDQLTGISEHIATQRGRQVETALADTLHDRIVAYLITQYAG